jgi:hypothetical protein
VPRNAPQTGMNASASRRWPPLALAAGAALQAGGHLFVSSPPGRELNLTHCSRLRAIPQGPEADAGLEPGPLINLGVLPARDEPCETGPKPAHIEHGPAMRAPKANKNQLICSFFLKPSDGLESATPSLPWIAGCA